MSLVYKASGLPASLTIPGGAAGVYTFSPSISLPANKVGVPIAIRVAGFIVLPAGSYESTLGVALNATGLSPAQSAAYGASTTVTQDDGQRVAPFSFLASMYEDVSGYLIDQYCPASVLGSNRGAQSASVFDGDSDIPALGINFCSAIKNSGWTSPLVLQVRFTTYDSNLPAATTAVLTQFEFEL
jgi:hypothetical protein